MVLEHDLPGIERCWHGSWSSDRHGARVDTGSRSAGRVRPVLGLSTLRHRRMDPPKVRVESTDRHAAVLAGAVERPANDVEEPIIESTISTGHRSRSPRTTTAAGRGRWSADDAIRCAARRHRGRQRPPAGSTRRGVGARCVAGKHRREVRVDTRRRGARFDDLEFSAWLSVGRVTNDVSKLGERLSAAFGAPVSEVLESPLVLAGTIDEIIDHLERRRARWTNRHRRAARGDGRLRSDRRQVVGNMTATATTERSTRWRRSRPRGHRWSPAVPRRFLVRRHAGHSRHHRGRRELRGEPDECVRRLHPRGPRSARTSGRRRGSRHCWTSAASQRSPGSSRARPSSSWCRCWERSC